MRNISGFEKTAKSIFGKTIIAFLVTFSLCAALIFFSISNRMSVEELKMEQLIMEKCSKVNERLSNLLYKTQTLAALVVQQSGEIGNFEQIAATIIDDPAILNVLVAPDGVVSHVYPMEGNEAVIGLDYFSPGAGNKEALLAKETGSLVFGGPFIAVQGGQILVGRLPIFTTHADGTDDFWGIVSVTLKYPQALDGVGLNELHSQGFAYEIWRYNPDDGEKQVITSSHYEYNARTRYIEKHISIQNADWYFRILPVRAWYEYPDTWLLVFLGLCVSVLVAFVMQNNGELKILKTNYEMLSHTDSLTGIFNRRYFMNYALAQAERAERTGSSAFVLIFDIDHFKQINDQYGHSKGDDVLKGVVARTSAILRPYDILARYGGEEFIILATDIGKEEAVQIAERIRLSISETPMRCGNTLIDVAASFGISGVLALHKLTESIDLADKALYMAKSGGRNSVVFYEHDDAPVA